MKNLGPVIEPQAAGRRPQAMAGVSILACGLGLVACSALRAQDVHFSQFYNSPLTLNPAMAGAIQGDQRFAVIHREQWQSIGAAFRTSSFSYDAPMLRGKLKGRYIGIGGNGYSDRAGTSGFGCDQANLSVAYGLRSSEEGLIAFSLQGGYGQRRATLDGMRWDAQYDGSGFDPSRPTGETMPNASAGYIDLSAGALWQVFHGREVQWTVGVSAFHLNQPAVGLFIGGEDVLLRRYTVHASTRISTKRWVILPKFYGSQQGGSRELVIGALLHRRLGVDSKYTTDKTSSSFYLGVFHRYGDAVIPSMLFEFKRKLVIGMSYDVTISNLRDPVSYRGGAELTLQYIGLFADKRRQLPKGGAVE